jgi:hypothetical protein
LQEPTTQQAKSTQAPQAVPSDPLEAFLSGKPTQAAPSAPMQESMAGGGRGSYVGFDPEQKALAEAQSTRGPRQPEGTSVGRMAGRLLGQVQENKQALGERVLGGIDTLYGVVPAVYGAGVQALARTANTPQEAERIGQQAAATIDKPLGKAFGITGKQTYQQPLGGVTEPVAKEVNKMFNVLGMTPEQISEKTGIPPQDIRNMVVIGSAALPTAIKEVTPVAKQAAQAIAKPIREAAAELQIQRPGATTAEAQAQFQAMQAKPGSVGAAAVQNNPYLGKITGEEVSRGGGMGEVFPQVKLTKTPKDVPVAEQQLRSQLFQEVLPDLKPRPGVITGNDNLLRNEHGLAAMAEPSPLGMKLKEQIANEQVGFSNYAQERVNATGASRSFTNEEQRGNFVNDVAHGTSRDDLASSSLTGFLNQSKKEIYDSAYKNMGNNRINTNHADSFFGNAQQLATAEKDGTLSFLNGAKKELELAKTVGFELPDGKIAPAGSVASFDAVIKSNNASWTPEKANTIRKINQAIGKDIAAVADPALYKLGDKIHQVEKNILGSNGFKRLFGEVDENGVVKAAIPAEKMLSTLNNLRKDEYRHIRDTFSELANGRVRGAPEGLPPVPPELQQAAKAALAEMDGALAREVYKAGGSKMGEWNSNSVNNVLTSTVGEKILENFSPDEIRKFGALNYVGQFTPPLKYEGAGQQTRRISLIERGLPGAGASAGAALGAYFGEGPAAIAGGTYIGREIGAKLQAKTATRAETKAVKKMEKEQKKATELGKQTGSNNLNELNK